MSYTYRAKYRLPDAFETEVEGQIGQAFDLEVDAQTTVDSEDGPSVKVLKVFALAARDKVDVTGLLNKDSMIAVAQACIDQEIENMEMLIGPDYQQMAEDRQERMTWALTRQR